MKLSKKFILEPHFFAVLAGLALPIALQDLIKFSLSLADNMMVGSLSEAALGAVTLASQPFFIFSMLSFGIASGGGVLVAQYYGKHDAESIQNYLYCQRNMAGGRLGIHNVYGSVVKCK